MKAVLWPQLWGASFPIQLEFSLCLLPVSCQLAPLGRVAAGV